MRVAHVLSACLRVVCFSVFVLPAAKANQPTAAVLGVRGQGVSAQQAAGVTEILAVELMRAGRFKVITQADVNALVDLSAMQDVLGCDKPDCLKTLSEIGGSLNVDRLLTGTISEVDGAKVLSVVLMHAKRSEIVGRGQARVGAGLDGTVDAVRQALLEALGYSGRIVLWNQPDGAQVYLDGRPVGTTPVSAIFVEKPATYRLQVFHEGRTPFQRDVEVRRGAVLRVKIDSKSLAELEEAANSRDALGNGLLGAGFLTGVAGGVFWFLAGKAQKDFNETDWRGRSPSDQQPYTDTITSRTTTAALFSVTALICAGAGAFLRMHNPHRDQLEDMTQSTGVLGLQMSASPQGTFAALSGTF